MKTEARRHPVRQQGQSTVEFVVLSLVLLPLLLAVPLVGKYMDIAQATALASRYVAFEGAVRHGSSDAGWKSDAELAQEVRRRFFSNSDAPVKSGDSAGDFDAHRNSLWFDHRSAALLPDFAGNVTAKANRRSLAQPAGAVFAGSLGLSDTNLVAGEVVVRIADVAGLEPFDALGLSVRRSTALLADPWAASGPADVKARIRKDGGNPAGVFPYEPLKLAAAPLTPFIGLLEFDSKPPDIGRVEPDRVPADRLGAAK
ncbi:MAG: hypothetical protein HGA75_01015 [Thiobacillus sp.]|nr:hypothetical protein [Thiobacillus sp.]